jgi:hypothetical protein
LFLEAPRCECLCHALLGEHRGGGGVEESIEDEGADGGGGEEGAEVIVPAGGELEVPRGEAVLLLRCRFYTRRRRVNERRGDGVGCGGVVGVRGVGRCG